MNRQERRVSPRDSDEAFVFINENPFGNFSRAVLHNSSKDGMYFETSCDIQHGKDVYIKAPRIESGEMYRKYQAKVKWCKDISSDENKPCFGLGLHIINEEHVESTKSSIGYSANCDKCGIAILPGEIFDTEKSLSLCSKCYNQFKTFPDGELKSCIENYLLGNVL